MPGQLLEQLELGRAACGRCAVCGLERRAAERYLQGVVNDGVNDIPLRRRLARRGGFCARHCRQFAEQSHLLSAAILLRDILNGRLERVAQARPRRRTECDACEAEAKAVHTLVMRIRHERRHPGLESALVDIPLCLPHLERLAPVLPRSVRQKMLSRFAALDNHLAEVVRKHDYRHADEPLTAEEKDGVRRVLELLGGDDQP